MERAAQGNLDLKSAMARVEQARFQIGVVTGDAMPGLTGNGGVHGAAGQRIRRRARRNHRLEPFGQPAGFLGRLICSAASAAP